MVNNEDLMNSHLLALQYNPRRPWTLKINQKSIGCTLFHNTFVTVIITSGLS